MTLAVSNVIQQPPPIGSLLYMASYMIKVALSTEVTPPDTPNMYSANLEIQGDQGDMDLSGLVGPRGFAGKADFQLRRQDTPIVNSTADLPTNLTNTPTDIGKYWQISTITDGVITAVTSYVWYGNRWKPIQMGTTGAPGPAPLIQPDVILIEPQPIPTYPDTTSFIATSGTRLEPSWQYNLAVPFGPPGNPGPIHGMPDVDEHTRAPVAGDVFACSGHVDTAGRAIWKPLSMAAFSTQFYSMPEQSFVSYSGMSQQAPVGSFAVPPQPFPWTPIVWGHMGMGGAELSSRPLMIGCQILLGDPVTGTLISRGLGNALGEVNIMPHYSGANHLADNITPLNNKAVVPANHTNPAQGTVYINLWNDGALGVYSFNPPGAQLFLLIMPMERNVAIAPF